MSASDSAYRGAPGTPADHGFPRVAVPGIAVVPETRTTGGYRTAISRQQLSSTFLVLVLYFVVGAAAFNGFFTKWQLFDDRPEFSLAAMLDGTAKRPWVYRQLLPQIANAVERSLPDSVKQQALSRLFRDNGTLVTKINTTLAHDRRYSLRYHGILYLTFAIFVGALFLLRQLSIQLTGDELAGTLAPLGFALFIPIIQSIGGYFYDFVELFFMVAAVHATLKRHWLLLAVLTVLATTNKEAFLFFVITLYPLARLRLNRIPAVLLVLTLMGLAGLTYLLLRIPYAQNTGGATLFQLWLNLEFYANPVNLFGGESTYSIILPSGYSAIVIALVVLVLKKGWSGTDQVWQQHLVLAAAVNLPLLLLFCAPGETRNLSLCFVGVVVVFAHAVSRWLSDLPSHQEIRRPVTSTGVRSI